MRLCRHDVRRNDRNRCRPRRARGLPAFRDRLRSLVSFFGDRVEELHDWNAIKLLTVVVDRLRTWHKPGLLCIGDAAHAMSPVGGVGINLAIQDAVATANLLAARLKAGTLTNSDLADLLAIGLGQRRLVLWVATGVLYRLGCLAVLFALGRPALDTPAGTGLAVA